MDKNLTAEESSQQTIHLADNHLTAQKFSGSLRRVIILLALIFFIGFCAYQIDFVFPKTPSIYNTYTPFTQPTAQEIGSYDVLGKVISKDEAAMLQTDEGKQQLSAENGAVEIAEDLIKLGRKALKQTTRKRISQIKKLWKMLSIRNF